VEALLHHVVKVPDSGNLAQSGWSSSDAVVGVAEMRLAAARLLGAFRELVNQKRPWGVTLIQNGDGVIVGEDSRIAHGSVQVRVCVACATASLRFDTCVISHVDRSCPWLPPSLRRLWTLQTLTRTSVTT
jgi:hypothetical protein